MISAAFADVGFKAPASGRYSGSQTFLGEERCEPWLSQPFFLF